MINQLSCLSTIFRYAIQQRQVVPVDYLLVQLGVKISSVSREKNARTRRVIYTRYKFLLLSCALKINILYVVCFPSEALSARLLTYFLR